MNIGVWRCVWKCSFFAQCCSLCSLLRIIISIPSVSTIGAIFGHKGSTIQTCSWWCDDDYDLGWGLAFRSFHSLNILPFGGRVVSVEWLTIFYEPTIGRQIVNLSSTTRHSPLAVGPWWWEPVSLCRRYTSVWKTAFLSEPIHASELKSHCSFKPKRPQLAGNNAASRGENWGGDGGRR